MSGDAPIYVERYELHRVIASGGMATVYLGRRRGAVGFSRVVAIKRMHPHLAREADFVEMFLDEARLASRIRHPNVVPIVDLVTADDEVLLVMEYVAGVPLDELLDTLKERGEQVPLRFAVRMLSDALHGLDAAHTAADEHGTALRVVHRDVSPQNLLVGADGATRVIDFGIAKAAGRLHKTRTGQTKGKIGYMAPEQMHGERLDSRSDQYALALTFWEVLVGERAIDGESEAEMMHRAMTEHIDPPRERNPEVPEALSALIMRAASRERTARFPTADAMANALDDSGAPIASPRALSQWLKKIVGESLDERAEWAAAVERGDEDFDDSDSDDSADEVIDATRGDTTEPERDTVSMSTLTRTVERSGAWRTRVALVALVAGGFVAGALAVGWWSARRNVATNALETSAEEQPEPQTPAAAGSPHAVGSPSHDTRPAVEGVPPTAPSARDTAIDPEGSVVSGRPSKAPTITPRSVPQPAPTPRPSATSSVTVPDHLLQRD